MESRAKKTWRIAAIALVVALSAALVSCGGTTRKKKYRFGGCQVSAIVSVTDTSLTFTGNLAGYEISAVVKTTPANPAA